MPSLASDEASYVNGATNEVSGGGFDLTGQLWRNNMLRTTNAGVGTQSRLRALALRPKLPGDVATQ